MKLENQVCTILQAQRLKELGVFQESAFYWDNYNLTGEFHVVTAHELDKLVETNGCGEAYAAYTVAELGLMLKNYISRIELHPSNSYLIIERWLPKAAFYAQKTEASARAELLIYLLENNLITAEEVNQRLHP